MFENKKKIVLSRNLKKEMMKFFMRTSAPRMMKDKQKKC